MRNNMTRKNHKHGFLHAFLMGVFAYYTMPRFCPRCFGLHSPLFGLYGYHYPGSSCHYPGDGCP